METRRSMEIKRIPLNTNIGFLPMSEFLKEKSGVQYYQKPILRILVDKDPCAHNRFYIVLRNGASISFEYGYDSVTVKNPYKELEDFFLSIHPKNSTSFVGYNFAIYMDQETTNRILGMNFIRKDIYKPEDYPNLINDCPYEIFRPSRYTESSFSVSEDITVTFDSSVPSRFRYQKSVNFYSSNFQENEITSFGNRLYCYTQSFLVTTAQKRYMKCPIFGDNDHTNKFVMPLRGYTFGIVYSHAILPVDEDTDEMVKVVMSKSNEEIFSLLYRNSCNFVACHENDHFFSGNPTAGFIWNEDFIRKIYFTSDLEPSDSKPLMVYTREDQKKLVDRFMKLYNGEERVIPIYLDVETIWNGSHLYHYTLTPDNELQDKE